MSIPIEIKNTDHPDFVAIVEKVISNLDLLYPLNEVFIIRVRGWFDHKWLNFSGIGRVPFESPIPDHPQMALDEFFQDQDTELLLGKRINPAVFNDYNVGRVLDKAYEIGAIRIFSAISKRAVDVFEVNNRHVSFDTTSVSVFGDYDLYPDDDQSSILRITHGHSKDKRPDLKQFLISMLCVDRNVPVFGKTEDGNGSDKPINNEMLTSISRRIASHGL